MAPKDDGLLPPHYEDEIAHAFKFVDDVADKYGIESVDVRIIARSTTKASAISRIGMLKQIHKNVREFDPAQMIIDCTNAYNQTSTYLVFGECVGAAMRSWEYSLGVQTLSIWAVHPSNFSSLRTYIWAQESFRQQVEALAQHRLTQLSPIGLMHDLDVYAPDHIRIGSPVTLMMREMRDKYSTMLGAYPLPE